MLALRYTQGCLGQARSTQHEPCAFSIKGRQFCKEFSIKFSCVNPNTRFTFLTNFKVLNLQQEEQKVEKILNKRKVREVIKYSVHWKRFTVENDTQKKEKDLENTRELVNKFERRIKVEVKRQEGLDKVQKVKLNPNMEKFRKSKLLKKYIIRILFE